MRPKVLVIALASLVQLSSAGAGAQAYITRGDEVERHYNAYRDDLQKFFEALAQRFARDAPDLVAKIQPPAPVPYGYQLLPKLLPNAPGGAARSRVKLSPFSWPRTDSLLQRDRFKLDSLKSKLAGIASDDTATRVRYETIADEYKKLVADQKLADSWIQYNRLWQSEVAKHPDTFAKLRVLQQAALERQLIDDASATDRRYERSLHPRADSLSRLIDAEIRKFPTANYVRVDHPDTHQWVLSVPMYTDIIDSAFVETARQSIENDWHVTDGDNDFSVHIEMRRLSPARLYANATVPERGAHIDVASHIKRFPEGAAILTTGANTIYSIGRAIVLGPQAVIKGAIAHEFGHTLGFRDGYFRSYEDLGVDGYEILEVILDPEEIVAAPENGRVRREHFEAVINERKPQAKIN